MAGASKLAYVCHIFPYLTQTFVYREVEELQRAGIPLTVFSMKPAIPALTSPESRHLMEDTSYLPRVVGAEVILSQIHGLLRAPRRYLQALALVGRGRYRFNNSPLLWLHGLVDFARGVHLARLLVRDGGYCHLYAQFGDDACTTTMVASILTGIPFSFRSHTSPNPQLIHEKVRRAQFVASASRYDKRVLVHWCGERVANKIHVNRLGVPLDRYTVDAGVGGWAGTREAGGGVGSDLPVPNPQPPTPNPHPLFLSVGTLIPEKGFEYVIRACRLLLDQGQAFECLIVGDGPDRAKLEDLIRLLDLQGRVTLSPYRPQEELRRLFQQATVFTLPCIFPLNGNVDVIPLVLQEAMAMGRPVVSTPVSGIPELIQDGVNGLLAPEKDDEALAVALSRILRDQELAARLGCAARETVLRSFNVAVNGAELAAILRQEVPQLGAQRSERSASTEPPTPNPQPPTPDPLSLHPPLRVAWVAEIPVPYRISLYRRMRNEAGLDLKLFFCSTTQQDRDWTVALDGVPHVVLRGVTLAIRRREQFFLRVNPQVWRELSRFRPEVVVVGGYAHITMQLAMLWCRRTGTPYLINSETHSGTRPVAPSPRRPVAPSPPRGLTTALKRFFIRHAAAGLPTGTFARDYLLAHGGPPGRMFMLPNTCEVSAFARDSARARLCRESVRKELNLGAGPVVLYVGRLTPVKGLETLLRAFASVRGSAVGARHSEDLDTRMPEQVDPRPTLLLVGDGEQKAELEALAVELGVADGVRWAGSRPWAELPAVYAAADLFVLPSRFEPWGAVVLEAMACGLAVIVSDQVGCAPDLVRPGENGWIVPAGDADVLAAALQEALAEPAQLARMGGTSSRLSATCGEDACIESFVAAVNAALGETATFTSQVQKGKSPGCAG